MDDLKVWPPPPTTPESIPSTPFPLIRGQGYVIMQSVNMTFTVLYLMTLVWFGQAKTENVLLVHGIVYLVHSLLLIATGIFFLVYVYQAAKSVRRLGDENLSFEPVWTIGWFFVPLMNLYMPWKMLQTVWKESLVRTRDYQASGMRQNVNSSLVTAWWLTFLCYELSVVAWSVIKYHDGHPSRLSYWWGIADVAVSMFPAYFSINLVRAFCSRQEQSAKTLGFTVESKSGEENL